MIRYIKQREQRSCTPVAIVNALKFQRRPCAANGNQLLKRIKREINYQKDGTDPKHAIRLYKKFGFRKMHKPDQNKIVQELVRGNAIIADISFVSGIQDSQLEDGRTKREITIDGHTFVVIGFAIDNGNLHFHILNLLRHANDEQHVHERWYSLEEMIRQYSRFQGERPAWIRDVFVIPRSYRNGRRRNRRRQSSRAA